MQTKKETGKQTEKQMGILRFFTTHAKGQMRWFFLALVAVFVATLANFAMPQVFRYAVDGALGEGGAAALPPWLGFLAGGGLARQLLIYGGAIIVISLVAGLATFAARTAVATGTQRFCQNLRDRLFRHIQHLPFSWQVENQTGDIIQRCTSDLDVVRAFAEQQLIEVVRTITLIVVALVMMMYMNVPLALVTLAFVPIVGFYSVIFYRLIGHRFLAADEAEGELTINVQENLTGVRVVRAFGREKYEMDKFDKQNKHYANLWIRLGRTLSIYWGTGDIATGMQIFAVILIGGIMAARGSISLGQFLVFVSYNQSLAWPVRSLGRTLSEMSKTGVSAQRMQEILDVPQEKAEPNAQKPELYCDIRFEDLSFAYDESPVLEKLNFTIKKGSTFGILGATGSGKSTLTYLLNRLYDIPNGSGSIYFGDVEIREIDRQYLRRHVGLVLQEPFLFSKTIEENIAIALPEDEGIDHARVQRAAAVAAVDEAIEQFTHGYATMVGERGVTLSGGQKQRVAIARTLILDAPVMIFDDSMSAVDLETDAKIRAALRSSTAAATVILISHRINTLMHADNILVLENGKLADMGSHKELIMRDGVYKRIYDMQSEAAKDAGESLESLAGDEKYAQQGVAADA